MSFSIPEVNAFDAHSRAAQNNQGIDIYKYIVQSAINDKDQRAKVINFIMSNGYPQPRLVDAVGMLKACVQKIGSSGIYELAKIHPDRDLIIAGYLKEKEIEKDSEAKTEKENKGNCSKYNNSCGMCAAAMLAADGQQTPGKNLADSNKIISSSNLMIMAGVSLTLIAMVTLVVVSKN